MIASIIRLETGKLLKFHLGRVLSTPGALALLETNGMEPLDVLKRHATGDWGDICAEDVGANEQSIKDGSRILSVYKMPDGEKVWIITEAATENGSRLATTLLLPEEY